MTMESLDNSTPYSKELFLKAADISWSPDQEASSEIKAECLRHRGIDRLVLRFGPDQKQKGILSKIFSSKSKNPITTFVSCITIADDSLTLEQNSRETSISLQDIRAIEIVEASRHQKSSLRLETPRTTLRCGNDLEKSSLQWLRDRILLEAAGLMWKPIFNVGRRTTLKTVSPDFDTYMLWPNGRHALFESFFSTAPSQALELISALNSKDFEVARKSAKSLKASCAVVGATYLSGLCQRIEVHLDNQEDDRIDILEQNFVSEFNTVLTHLLKISGRPVEAADLLKETTSKIEIPIAPKSASILLVEDSLVNQEIAIALLSEAGHVMTVASSGREAIDFMQDNTFDLILMDCQMPGLSGIETTKEVRAFESQQGRTRTPIVAMTANALKDDRKRCLNSSMDDYMSKPYSPNELFSMVNRWIVPQEPADLEHVQFM